jgi:hypothetical protein
MKGSIGNLLTQISDELVELVVIKLATDNSPVLAEAIRRCIKQNPELVTTNSTTGYLSENELLNKYKISRAFFSRIKKEHLIDRVKIGQLNHYLETDFIHACKKNKPKKPNFK